MFLVPLPSGLYNKHKLPVTFLVGSQFVCPGPFRLGAILPLVMLQMNPMLRSVCHESEPLPDGARIEACIVLPKLRHW